MSLWNNYSFCEIHNYVQKIFKYYISLNSDTNIKAFYQSLLEALNNFAEAKECEDFVFYFHYRTENEYSYIQFNIETNVITIYEGGSVYTPDVGSDSFTNWRYSICNDGFEEGSLELSIASTIRFINIGADLHIELTEEFDIIEEDE